MAQQRVYIYVDGFNLYYGCLRNSPHKWLNPLLLCQNLIQGNIVAVRYYTALVSGRSEDPNIPNRQKIYLRALRTLENLTIHLGHYLTNVKWMPLAQPVSGGPRTVKVIRTEEKGTDVNIASHLLFDGFKNRYDTAVVVSNDSDLVEPIRIAINDLGKKVGVINPHTTHPCAAELQKVATFRKPIRSGVLQLSQFPPVLSDGKGTFHKPVGW